MLETDIGGSFIIIVTALSVLAASGIKKRTFMKISGIISVGLVFAALVLYFKWETIMTPGRAGRILSFLNPFDYIQGSGYQIANGYIAIGSGGVTRERAWQFYSENGLFAGTTNRCHYGGNFGRIRTSWCNYRNRGTWFHRLEGFIYCAYRQKILMRECLLRELEV